MSASSGEAVFDGACPAEEDRKRLGLRRREQVAAMLVVRRCELLEVCGFLLVEKAWVPLPTAAHLTGVEVYFRALGFYLIVGRLGDVHVTLPHSVRCRALSKRFLWCSRCGGIADEWHRRA